MIFIKVIFVHLLIRICLLRNKSVPDTIIVDGVEH